MSNNANYNSWPIGKIPKELQRPELDQLKKNGYEFDDPRQVIDIFEKKVAEFAGSKYAVAVDCCTHAMELALMYQIETGEIYPNQTVVIPERTYISAYLMPKQMGLNVVPEEIEWSGVYHLKNTRVYDGAVRWTKGMYVGNNALQCVSFQIKKRIPIGRGGVVLCDNKEEYDYIKLLSYDGRDLNTPYTDMQHIRTSSGKHYYMTPEDAARGIILIDAMPEVNEDTGGSSNYPTVSSMIEGVQT